MSRLNYLESEIDYLLKFDSHISSICRKAAQQINILKRLGKHLTKLNKLTIFHTFIVSNFNYCPLSWHFCTERNTTKLEKLQERALRFVYDDYVSSYDDLLDRAKIPSLKLRRIKTMAIEAFKIVHGIAPPCLHDCLTLTENRYNFRYTNILQVPQVRTTTYGKKSFKYAAAVLWNNFPEEFRKTNNFNHFKSLVAHWNGGGVVNALSASKLEGSLVSVSVGMDPTSQTKKPFNLNTNTPTAAAGLLLLCLPLSVFQFCFFAFLLIIALS